MVRRLYLHIGAMKSGTSFIQNVLGAHKEQIQRDHGLLFPGKRWRKQVGAVHDLIETGGRKQEPMAPDGPWRTIAAEINAWDGDAVFSMEFLGPRSLEKIRQIEESFPSTDLQVVLTGRDLARSIPAMWQESVQNAATVTWPEFLTAVREERRDVAGPGRWFWNHQALAEMADRWSTEVGRDHFTFVTVPPSGADPALLWTRFADVVGLGGATYSLDVRANPSIGVASAMVMREINLALHADELSRSQYHALVKHGIAKRGLAHRAKQEPRLGLDEPWVHERGMAEIAALEALRLQVVGDLAELTPQPVRGVHTDDVGLDDQLAAAVDALAIAVENCEDTGKGKKRRKRRLGRGRRQGVGW